jgi:CRP-like cAMP-binding protein
MAGTYEWRGLRRQGRAAGKSRFFGRTDLRDPENLILTALGAEEHRRLRPYLEFVPLRAGDVLWEPGQPIEFVYFPTSGLVSFVAVMRNGATVEVGMTGREGFVGTPIILGARDSPVVRAVVQIAGECLRIESDLLRRMLPQVPQLEGMLRRYAHSYATQAAQAAACNCLHQVPERLARWLAMSRDRAKSDLLPLTQESLAQMLGCRRSSVTSAIGRLQRAGIVRVGHGQVRVLDRKQLEKGACECYEIIKTFFPA